MSPQTRTSATDLQAIELFNRAMSYAKRFSALQGKLINLTSEAVDFEEQNADIVGKIAQEEQIDEQYLIERLKESGEIFHEYSEVYFKTEGADEERVVKAADYVINKLAEKIHYNGLAKDRFTVAMQDAQTIDQTYDKVEEWTGGNDDFAKKNPHIINTIARKERVTQQSVAARLEESKKIFNAYQDEYSQVAGTDAERGSKAFEKVVKDLEKQISMQDNDKQSTAVSPSYRDRYENEIITRSKRARGA